MSRAGRKDLVVLVADSCIEASVRGLLSRPEALAIRPVNYDTFTHPERDPGCLVRPHAILGPLSSQYKHALVVLDHDGCGREGESREALERSIVDRLESEGWPGRSGAVVITPEVEAWVWSDSPHVAACLGWANGLDGLRAWLASQGQWEAGARKPADPKECVDRVRRAVGKPRSSAIYGELARKVSTSRCQDPAFIAFKSVLHGWFGEHMS